MKCYEIKDENFETIGRTITTSFTYEILDNEAHNFYIYAVDNGGNLSQTPLTLTAQRDMSCEDISELTVEQDDNNLSQINISWNEVEDSRFLNITFMLMVEWYILQMEQHIVILLILVVRILSV